jgi:hypothetical protein
LSRPPVLVDEDFPLPVAEALRKRGFSVIAAVETPPRSLSDEDQLRRATAQGCVLVSHNRRDFVRVAHRFRLRDEPQGGVVLPPRDISQERLLLRTAMLLDWRASLPEPRPDVMLWNDLQQRLIRGLRLTGYSEDEVRRVLGWAPA